MKMVSCSADVSFRWPILACTLRWMKSGDDVGHSANNGDILSSGSLRCDRYCLKNARLDGEIEITI